MRSWQKRVGKDSSKRSKEIIFLGNLQLVVEDWYISILDFDLEALILLWGVIKICFFCGFSIQSSCSQTEMQRSMDLASFRCLTNSISRFIHLVTCCISSTMPTEKDYRNVASLLKHLKPVLDEFINLRVPQNEALYKECEELDAAVNEAREFLEKWSPRTSKIMTVLRSRPVLLKVQLSSVKLSRLICRQVESSRATSCVSSTQFCLQESQNLKIGQLSEHIGEILRSQKGGKLPVPEHLSEIIDFLNLASSQEILNESIALEKEKQIAEKTKMKEDLDQISQAADFMSHIRDCVANLDNFRAQNGVQIPSYFRCPLSLELMLDPVIVASGQTYERAAIQKWWDNGLVRCPKTGIELSHGNIIPNFTVKALIENWCDENKVKLSKNHPEKGIEDKAQCDSGQASREGDFQCSIQMRNSASRYSYAHSRSESASSAVSSIDYVGMAETESRLPSKQNSSMSGKSGDLNSACSTSSMNKTSGASPSFFENKYNSAKTMAEMVVNGNHNPSRSLSFPSESGYNELTTASHVEKLIKSLKSDSNEIQTAAAGELRFLAKYNMENRVTIGECGAIAPLISLLHSNVELTQEHAVTALLNLSINENIKARIAESNALEPLIHVLKTGNAGAKENTAAALFSISLLDEYRIKIGQSGAVQALVDLLRSGTVRGKKDAATALFNLSIYHENKARIVQTGAVKYLVGFLDPATEMVDKAVALLANLSTIAEGCSAIAREEGIPPLVEVVEMGSLRGKENAASILLQLCLHNPKYCRSILQEGAVPPLVALSQSGTPRAKEKAQQLLSHFRNQREGTAARGR